MDTTIIERLRRVRGNSIAIAGPNGVNGAAGHLSGFALGYVTAKYQDLIVEIAELRDPATPPNLDPPDAGSPIPGYDPTLTNQYADDFVKLATEAVEDSESPNPSDQYIGDRLATISSLTPGFRTVAGLP